MISLSVLLYFFAWPLGQVWGNLLAGFLQTIIVWFYTRKLRKKIHETHELHKEVHTMVTSMHERGGSSG